MATGGRVKKSITRNATRSEFRAHIGSLPEKTTWRQVKEFVSKHAEVIFCDMIKDTIGTEAVVEFGSQADLDKVLQSLEGSTFENSSIVLTVDTEHRYGPSREEIEEAKKALEEKKRRRSSNERDRERKRRRLSPDRHYRDRRDRYSPDRRDRRDDYDRYRDGYRRHSPDRYDHDRRRDYERRDYDRRDYESRDYDRYDRDRDYERRNYELRDIERRERRESPGRRDRDFRREPSRRERVPVRDPRDPRDSRDSRDLRDPRDHGEPRRDYDRREPDRRDYGRRYEREERNGHNGESYYDAPNDRKPVDVRSDEAERSEGRRRRRAHTPEDEIA